ncbi:MAG: hypothetical protein JO142_02755 [Burkholderiales bacterium]|nr:hypothetical protein [Burkholderiales bacterium]
MSILESREMQVARLVAMLKVAVRDRDQPAVLTIVREFERLADEELRYLHQQSSIDALEHNPASDV